MSDNLPVHVVACPHPFKIEKLSFDLAERVSIAQLVEEIQPDPMLRKRVFVYVDDVLIPREDWETTYPNPGAHIFIKVVPQGPIAALFVAVAAVVAALGVKAALVPIIGAFWATAIGVTVGFGVTILGSILVRALIPPPSARGLLEQKKDPQVFFLEGARNEIRLYSVVPCVLGTHRMVPPFAALPYTEILGNDQYLYFIVCWGYGPVELSDIRIGETPIRDFKNVSVQHRYGYPNDPPLTLYTNSVFEEPLSILLKQKTGWQRRTSQPDADELSVDIVFLRGLFRLKDDGGKAERTVKIEIEYRKVGESNWVFLEEKVITAKSMEPVRRGVKWAVSKGQYEVRLRRTTEDTDSTRIQDEATWTALRTIKKVYPINCPADLALTAIKIKATEQLHGVIDTLNGVVSKLILDWDKGSQTWVLRKTSNPASIYRYILQGQPNHVAISDDELDLEAIQKWHEFCEENKFEFNVVKDWEGDVEELLAHVAAAGRASLTYVDGKRSVIIDTVKTEWAGVFSPRNTKGFSGEKLFADMPHGFRCRFPNRHKDWRQDEIIVYDDGYNENNATKFEEITLVGITDPDHVWKIGRYHLAVARLRPETYSFYTDLEHITCTRGDLIRFNHSVPLWGLSSGRVTNLIVNTNGWLEGVQVDEICPMEAGKSYSVRFRLDTGEQIVEELQTIEGDNKTLFFLEPLLSNEKWPDIGNLFLFGELEKESVDLLVLSIEPSSDLTAKIICVPYNEAIYAADQGPIPPWDSLITIPQEWWVPIIEDVRSDGSVLYLSPDGTLVSRILVTYRIISGIDPRIVAVEAEWWRTEDGEEGPTYTATAVYYHGNISLMPVEDKVDYTIRLRFVKSDGQRGPWCDPVTHTVVGKIAPPSDVTGFYVFQSLGVVTFIWDEVPDLDVAGYEIRYGPPGCSWETEPGYGWCGASWCSKQWCFDGSDVVVLTRTIRATSFSTTLVQAGTWDFMVKAFDTSGNESVNETRIRATIYQYYEIVSDIRWNKLAWPGDKTGWVRDCITNYLESEDSLSADGDNYLIFDHFVYQPFDGQYYETPEVDLGKDISGRAWYMIEYYLGAGEYDINAPVLQFDFRADGGEYNGWQDLSVTMVKSFTGRYVKYRLYLDNTTGKGQIYVKSLRTIIDKF